MEEGLKKTRNNKDYTVIKWGEYVYYDETSPTFLRWKVKTGKMGKDTSAGCTNAAGYTFIGFQGNRYYTHRIIWCLFHNTIDSELHIDHCDGDRANNSISNLRLVHPSINYRNQTLYSNNTSGVAGVFIADDGRGNRYYVSTWCNLSGKLKKKHFSIAKLGETEAFRLACEYRQQMIEELNSQGAGYSERHGT